jgi:hypothetical protein
VLSVRLAAPPRVRVPIGRRPWEAARAWRVVHVGQSAVILAAASGEATGRLLGLTSPWRGLVPGGVCLPDRDAFAALARLIAEAARPATPEVDLGAWAVIGPDRTTTVDLRIRPVAVRADAVRLLTARLAATKPAAPPAAAMDPRPARILAVPLAHAVLADNEAGAGQILRRLVGVGPGATPAGDDVIVGVIAALDAAAGSLLDEERARAARALLAAALQPLLDRTTSIARHDLTAAIAGEFAESVHRVVAGLADPAAVPAAVAAARGTGATSGVDLASGMVAAALIWQVPSAAHRPLSTPAPHDRRIA